MAIVSFLAFAVVVGIFVIAKYIETAKKNKLPAGIQKLPGPKGMQCDMKPTDVVLYEAHTYRFTIPWQCTRAT
jgi:hypothetical protein